MANFDSLKFLEAALDIDFEKDPFPAVIDKLASARMTSFRLNWKPDVMLCVVFEENMCKAMNKALDVCLKELEENGELSGISA